MEFFIFVLNIGAIIFIYFKLLGIIKKQKRESYVPEEVRKEIAAIITEFNRTSDRNIQLLDDRIKELQELLKIADKKIFQIDKKYRKISTKESTPILVNEIIQPGPEQPTPKTLNPQEQIADVVNITPPMTTKDRVLNLAREGKTIDEIVELLQLRRGEVDLILRLNS